MKIVSDAGYVVQQMIRRYFADNVSPAAAELAYFLLFSFFPLLMLLNAVLAHIQLPAELLQATLAMLPNSMQEMIVSYLTYISNEPSFSPVLIGIGLTLFFLTRAMKSLIRTINRLYRVRQRAGTLVTMINALLLTLCFLFAIGGSLVLVVAGRTILRIVEKYIAIPAVVLTLTRNGGYLLAIAMVFLFLLLLNRMIPNAQLRWRDVMPGAIFSLVTWLILSAAFSFYVNHMARYSVLYGSLGAMIVLMLWLYLTGMVIILGAQLNHVLCSMHSAVRTSDEAKEVSQDM